jgi:hypothetical protein
MAAPLAKPVRRTSWPLRRTERASERVATLARVSVVRMAWAARSSAAAEPSRAAAAARIPSSTHGMGRCRPMTPVEQTSICSAGQPTSSAARAAIRRASSRPRWPVQALALPEQMTTPRASARGSRSRQTRTGAATTRFCVNTPAAAAGVSLTTRARSSRLGSGRRPL